MTPWTMIALAVLTGLLLQVLDERHTNRENRRERERRLKIFRSSDSDSD